jgi:hypothetical protein
MTQVPFSRPGAVDLSALKRTPPPSGASGAPAPSRAAGGAYDIEVTEQNFQSVLESSMTAPVLLVFYSPSRAPETADYAGEVAAVVGEYDGRFLAALADIDAQPAIAQAMQIQQVPLLLVILEGRPATQPIPGVLPAEDLRMLLQQLGQQLTASGITGRHQPRADAVPVDEDAEPAPDPRYAAAQDALERNDIDAAVVAARPASSRATGTRKGEQGDVVEFPGLVEEVDRLGVAAVLTADPTFRSALVSPRLACPCPHEPSPRRGPSSRLERGDVEDAVLEVGREERRLHVVTGEAPRHLGQVVGAEGEELRRRRDPAGREAARGSSIMVPILARELHPRRAGLHVLGDLASISVAYDLELAVRATSGTMISGAGRRRP